MPTIIHNHKPTSKKVKLFLIVASSLIILFIIARLTDAFNFYSMPTPSNEPSIKQGSLFFASNLLKESNLDLVVFAPHLDGDKKTRWIFRLMGVGGDRIEMKNGVFYVNDVCVDKKLKLGHMYQSNKLSKSLMIEKYQMKEDNLMGDEMNFFVNVSDEIAEKESLLKVPNELSNSNEFYFKNENDKWNSNSFGPLVIPKDSIFLLGDSRDNAMDSRYIGYVNEDHVLGKVLWK
jgi:signal peptidase I